MRKLMSFLCLLGCIAGSSMAAAPAANIFSDNFNRATNADIDADAPTGMSGQVGTITYDERDEVLHTNVDQALLLTNIENNALHLADGPNMSTLYLDHNFTEAGFTNADGMRISMVIVSNDGTLVDGGRMVGFGVGSTQAEASTAEFDWTATATSAFRGNGSVAGTSDMFVGWNSANGGYLEIFKNGPTSAGGEDYTIPVGALQGNDLLELELYFDDFNDNSEVSALVLWNGSIVAADNFNWDADGALENYVSIVARQNAAGFTVDNLAIEAIYNDRANTFSPDGSEKVVPSSITLDWEPGKDNSGNVNSDITGYYLYVTSEVVDNEPNFASAPSYTLPSQTSNQQIAVEFDRTYFWRVDESVNNSLPSDAATIAGPVWSFETLKSLPVVLVQPVNSLTYDSQEDLFNPAEPVLTCVFTSISPNPTVRWLEVSDPENPQVINSDAPVYDSEAAQYTSTLEFANVSAANEGRYVCEITNAAVIAGEDPVMSDTASLGVRRLKAHWAFEEFDSVNGVYPDETGNYPADPNTNPLAEQFVSNSADPVELGNALDLTIEGDAAADAGNWAASEYTGQVTISSWVYYQEINGWQGIVSNRVSPDEGNFYMEINTAGYLQLNAPYFNAAITAQPLPLNEWLHIAVTAGPDGAYVYINGEVAAQNVNPITVTELEVPMYVGCLQREGGILEDTAGLINTFNGQIDDIRVYNYARSQEEIIDLYYEMLETAVCLTPNHYDFNDDCIVDVSDFASFAADWLNCGLYPDIVCY